MDEVLDGSEAGDATAARRPRRQPMPAERPSDLVEPFAMLQQRASDVGHRTVPRWSGELEMNGTEHRTNRAPASALPPNGRQDHQPWPSAGSPTSMSTPDRSATCSAAARVSTRPRSACSNGSRAVASPRTISTGRLRRLDADELVHPSDVSLDCTLVRVPRVASNPTSLSVRCRVESGAHQPGLGNAAFAARASGEAFTSRKRRDSRRSPSSSGRRRPSMTARFAANTAAAGLRVI